jgi:hypothetical protein
MRLFLALISFTLLLFGSACFHLKPTNHQVRLHLLDQSSIVDWTQYETLANPENSPRIQRVDLPDYLHELRIFYRRADGTPAYVDTDRWAEPLRDGIARYLAIALVGNDKLTSTTGLRLDFRSFDPVRGSGVWVDVAVEHNNTVRHLRFREGTGHYRSTEALIAEMAAALDTLITKL